NATAATTETVAVLNVGLSAGNFYGTSTVTLQANAAQPLTLTANAFGGIPIGSSSLIRGVSGTAGPGLANLNIGAVALGGIAGGGGALYDPGVLPGATARDGLPVGLAVTSGGILAFAGNTNLNVGRLESSGANAFQFQTLGNLTVTGTLFNTTNGLNKGGAGT